MRLSISILLPLMAAIILGESCKAREPSGVIRQEDPVPKADPIDPRQCTGASPEVRAYVEQQRARYKIVATTVTRRGEIIDWIDPRSQVPDGELGTPPPLDPRPDSPPPDGSPRPRMARGDLEDEPEAWGPPGTVPMRRPNLDKSCARTVQEFLDPVGHDLGIDPYAVPTPRRTPAPSKTGPVPPGQTSPPHTP